MRKTSIVFKVFSLLCVSLLLHEPFLKGQGKTICGPLYPRVLGGSTGSTNIETMDQYEEITYVGGYTMESALTGGSSSSFIVGFIA
jgi:hypothetical protein